MKRFLALMAVVSLISLSGCVAIKAHIKPEEMLEPVKESKEQAQMLFKEGALLLNDDPKAAALKFRQAHELDRNLIPAWYNEGLAHELSGDQESAEKSYEGCLLVNKQQPACLSNLLMVKHNLEKFDEAKTLLASYLSEFGDQPFSLVAAAKYYLLDNDLAQAEHYARSTIEREADNVEALYVMAQIFYQKKQYSAAKWVAKNALELAPSYGALHLLLGHVYKAQSEFHEALDSYALAVKYQPDEEALENYGLMLLKRGRTKEALADLERLVMRAPHVFQNQLHVGNAYMANKQFAEAKAAYLEALSINPDEKEVNFNLGLLYFDLKPEGLSELERLKTSQIYFKTYLEMEGLSTERIKEVKEYLKTLEQKIELEEYAIESAKEEKTETEIKPEEKSEVSAPEHTEPAVSEPVPEQAYEPETKPEHKEPTLEDHQKEETKPDHPNQPEEKPAAKIHPKQDELDDFEEEQFE